MNNGVQKTNLESIVAITNISVIGAVSLSNLKPTTLWRSILLIIMANG